MTEGYIIWDANANRPDIKYDDNTYYGGLHCGNTLEALICDKWMPTRIEYSHSAKAWYLVGIENSYDILWLTVRI